MATYRQKDGVAMGSPLGPILADFFMAMLETRQLKDTIANFHVYQRFVDDIFCVADSNCDIGDILQRFNTAHESVQFTVEVEQEDRIPFLDVLLTRKCDGFIERCVYRKKTWTGQYTNFHSFVPLRQKRNLVKCLVWRANNICSSETLHDELRLITDVLRSNGYPDKFIQKNMTNHRPPKAEIITAEKKGLFLSLPFKGDCLSESLTRRLNTALRSTFNAAKLRCSFKSSPLINIRNKDKLPVLTASMVVYSFRCICDAFYVGRTARQLSTRMREHHPRWLSQGGSGTISSAILAHLVDTGHRVDPNQAFRVIYQVPPNRSKNVRMRTLAIAEAIGIKRLTPDLCAQKRLVHALHLPWPTSTHMHTNTSHHHSVCQEADRVALVT